MGRDTTADRTPLLTDAEQNIGNSDQLNPEDGLLWNDHPSIYPSENSATRTVGSTAGRPSPSC